MPTEEQIVKTIPAANVSLASAAALIAAGLKAAKEAGFEATVAVTDSTGALRALERSDHAPFLTVDVATNKAWTAASYGYPTHVWNDYVADPKVAPLQNLPRMMAVGGGYPLMSDGRLVGGIGISGGSYIQDQAAAEAALNATGFKLPD